MEIIFPFFLRLPHCAGVIGRIGLHGLQLQHIATDK